jgi:hypothetical protein
MVCGFGRLQEQKVVMLNPALVTMSRTIFNHVKSELETDVRSALTGHETDPAKIRYAQELHKVSVHVYVYAYTAAAG